jgi:hypothetical protein
MHDHVTPALQQLHWLPIKYRIIYKLSVLMRLVHTGRSPAYLFTLVTAASNLASCRCLRSACSQRYEIPRTALKFGERAFLFAGPTAWNSLPSYLHEQSDSKLFKAQLESFLFSIAFLC